MAHLESLLLIFHFVWTNPCCRPTLLETFSFFSGAIEGLQLHWNTIGSLTHWVVRNPWGRWNHLLKDMWSDLSDIISAYLWNFVIFLSTQTYHRTRISQHCPKRFYICGNKCSITGFCGLFFPIHSKLAYVPRFWSKKTNCARLELRPFHAAVACSIDCAIATWESVFLFQMSTEYYSVS